MFKTNIHSILIRDTAGGQADKKTRVGLGRPGERASAICLGRPTFTCLTFFFFFLFIIGLFSILSPSFLLSFLFFHQHLFPHGICLFASYLVSCRLVSSRLLWTPMTSPLSPTQAVNPRLTPSGRVFGSPSRGTIDMSVDPRPHREGRRGVAEVPSGLRQSGGVAVWELEVACALGGKGL